jgi:REP element-mobilizing transposase RayT
MDEGKSLSHPKWECKYHVAFLPKCRRHTLYGRLRRYFRHQESKDKHIDQLDLLR